MRQHKFPINRDAFELLSTGAVHFVAALARDFTIGDTMLLAEVREPEIALRDRGAEFGISWTARADDTYTGRTLEREISHLLPLTGALDGTVIVSLYPTVTPAADLVTLESAGKALQHLSAHNGPGRSAEAFNMLEPATADQLTPEQYEKARDAVVEALGDAYDCTRVWSAWSVGTMGPGDFSSVAHDDDRLNEITRAALHAIGLKTPE